MSLDAGDYVGVVAAFKAGEISQREARRMLRACGTGDDLIDDLLSVGVGIAVGAVVGNVVDDLVDGFFGD